MGNLEARSLSPLLGSSIAVKLAAVPAAPIRLEPAGDPEPAAWIESRLRDWTKNAAVTVASIVPEGFEAYTRIFHPIWDPERAEEIRWSTLAARSGIRSLRPDTRFQDVRAAPSRRFEPRKGSLFESDCVALAGLLGEFTTRPGEVWFAIWLGYQSLARDSGLQPSSAIVRTPGREYSLYRGPLAGAMSFHRGPGAGIFQSPSIWWPDDHRWCVGTEVDLESTYVGGSRLCIDAILASERLESVEVTVSEHVDRLG